MAVVRVRCEGEVVVHGAPGRRLEGGEVEVVLRTGDVIELGRGAPPPGGPALFVQIKAVTVARRHCRVTMEEDGSATVQDMSSPGGTYVNGKHLRAIGRLRDGDVIQLGSAASVVFLANPDTST